MVAGVQAMLSVSTVATIVLASDVCRRVISRLACTWLLMATGLLVVHASVASVMRNAKAAVAMRYCVTVISSA